MRVTRSTDKVHQGPVAGGWDLLCRLCLSMPGVRGGPGRVVLALPFPEEGIRWLEVLLPAVLGNCTGLYVAVRRIGGAEGPAHVHIADSVAAGGIIRGCFRRSEPMRRCRW